VKNAQMATSHRKVVAVAMALAALCAPRAPAQAGPAEEAETLIKRGVALRRQRNDGAALQQFRRAYELSPSGKAAAQMGLAEYQLRLWVEADKHLAEALRYRSDGWVRTNRELLVQSLKTVARHVGRLVVGGEPAGADVFLNGQNAGTIPLREPATVVPGPVHVEVRSAGYTAASLSVVVPAGDVGSVQVNLVRERALTPAPIAESRQEPAAGRKLPSFRPARRQSPPPALERRELAGGPLIEPVHEEADPFDRPPPEPGGASAGVRTARWVVLGATGLFLAAGITAMVISEHETRLFNEGCAIDSFGNIVVKTSPPPFCRKVHDNAANGKIVGIVGLAGAGLLGITSAVLFVAF
jgi:PEGA domain